MTSLCHAGGTGPHVRSILIEEKLYDRFVTVCVFFSPSPSYAASTIPPACGCCTHVRGQGGVGVTTGVGHLVLHPLARA